MSTGITILLWLTALVNGTVIGLVMGYLMWGKKTVAPPPAPIEPTKEEIELARKEREELIESQRAFRAMMDYNADIAYGIEKDNLSMGGS